VPLEHFDVASGLLEDALAKEGHFIIECVHNCGHAIPPFDVPPGGSKLDFVWGFLLDHPYWLAPGTSIYQRAWPSIAPSWCGIGKGSAVPRPEGSACE
jgi:hypothetical protein